MKIAKAWYDWIALQSNSPYAMYVLGALFFVESSILFMPVGSLLLIYSIENKQKRLQYAAIATIASVAGSVFGYLLGALLWQTIGTFVCKYLISPTSFDNALFYIREYQSFAVLIGAFFPLPFKLITIGAGFCHLSLPLFIINALIGRAARFFLLAHLVQKWGQQIKEYIDHSFHVVLGCGLLISATSILFIIISHR